MTDDIRREDDLEKEPELVVVVGGWFACGSGWCVRGDTIEEAVAEYHAALRRHAEIASRLAPSSKEAP